MIESALDQRLLDLMSLRAKAEAENPTPQAELNPVVHWVPERVSRWRVFDIATLERGILELKARKLSEIQDNYRQFYAKQ